MSAWGLFEDGSPEGESLAEVAARAERFVTRVRELAGDVLVFAHRDILRVILARWVALPAIEGRRFMLAPTSVSIMGYDHDMNEPLIRLLNG